MIKSPTHICVTRPQWVIGNTCSKSTLLKLLLYLPGANGLTKISHRFHLYLFPWLPVNPDDELVTHGDLDILQTTFSIFLHKSFYSAALKGSGVLSPERAGGRVAGQTSPVNTLTSAIFHGSFSNLAGTFIALTSQMSLIMQVLPH